MDTTTVITTLVTLAIGLFIPAVTAVVTKDGLAPWAKQAVLLGLSAVSGVLSSIVGAVPTTWAQWSGVLLNIALTWLAALAASASTWAETGGVAKIHKATARFGIGKAKSELPRAA